MVLIVRRFLNAVPWDSEVMRQVSVATINPGSHRRLGYGAAIRTTATLEFHLRIDLVFIPIMGVGKRCRGDVYRHEDEPLHGIPQVFCMRCSDAATLPVRSALKSQAVETQRRQARN
jgi:hypothetical protein